MKKYYAYVQNDNEAIDNVPYQTHNKRALKDEIRRTYGRGWTAHIMAVDIDGDGQSVMGAPYEVESFRLRG